MHLKFKADSIFNGTSFIEKDKVLVVNKNKTIEAIIDERDAGEDVQYLKGILSPGFINCHCHLELSHLKNIIPKHTGMVDFILHILSNRNMDIEFIEEKIAIAEQEMISNGIVAVGDICNTTHTIKQKQKGNLYYHNFIEVSGFVPSGAKQRFDAGIDVLKEFETNLPTQKSTLVPHAPYSVSKNLFSLIKNESLNKISTIHNQESIDEIDFFKNKKGDFLRLYKTLGIDISYFNPNYTSSFDYFIDDMLTTSNCILVHNTFIQTFEMEMLKKQPLTTQFYLCLCVLANEYITNCSPNIPTLFNNFQNIVVGTDSLASNDNLNILKELQFINELDLSISQEILLKAATLNGAKALGIEDNFGSFEKGKKSGVIQIEDFEQSMKPKLII